MSAVIRLPLVIFLFAVATSPASASVIPSLPGTLIHHSAASSGLYIGSPSLCIAPDGSYLASHDLFGPKSREYELARGRLYRSTDRGGSWQHVRDVEGFFWTGLFVRRGATWLLGTDKHHGRVVIRRSEDSGKTWSAPAVLSDGQWHTAPMPVIEHEGRIWRAIEDAHTSDKWGERYRARMMSAPADANLLDPASWTFSSALARDAAWLDGDFAAWLEGNAIAGPDGGIVNLLRADTSRLPEKAAMVRLSKDGLTATFDPVKDFVDLLYHPDVVRHGFQYMDWQFDGDDLIAACRTAWDDAEGGVRNNHDANFLTFHRWRDFRALERKDDVPMPDFR